MARFLIEIRGEPAGKDHLGRDVYVRLRRFLKDALRRYGLRCVTIRPLDRGDDAAADGRPTEAEALVPDGRTAAGGNRT